MDAIATTKDFATKNSLKSVADLKKLDSFTVGARPEFKSRYQGLKGMQKVYGLTNAQFKQLALGIQYQALDKGDVDSANVFSTDAQLASGKYTVLEDPKGDLRLPARGDGLRQEEERRPRAGVLRDHRRGRRSCSRTTR